MKDFEFRISNFEFPIARAEENWVRGGPIRNPQSEIPELGWWSGKFEIRNPKSEMGGWVAGWI
jgi:hypothetical protein